MSKIVDYRSAKTPAFYLCHKCFAAGCRLWRRANSFTIRLYCADCAERSDQSAFDERFGYGAIGGLVAAVPTEDGDAYWGYTSIPPEAVAWWDRLPMRTGPGPREWSPRKKGIPL